MSDDLVKRLRSKIIVHTDTAVWMVEAADRIEELEAENKLLNEQMAAIEEHGTESLNALPDCLMRLAPALVEIDELKAKLAKAVGCLESIAANTCCDRCQEAALVARTTLAELKGEE